MSYQTPEVVQRSAEDYLDLGKEQSAFDMLVNYMCGKKPRQWSQAMEKIMTMIIDLAIKFNKKEIIREPLNNYKFAAQYSNINSLESVLSYLLRATEEKHEAITNLTTPDMLDMEDLENQDPYELFVASLDVDSKTERTIIRASLRTIWETYRMIMEITCRNKKLEDLYALVCHKAFEFCKRYKRRIEFKRLCESIRNNLNSIIKTMITNPDYNKIPFAIDLTNLETNEKQILIRLDQLDYTYHFELSQETLKTLDDIHNIMTNRKALVKPKILSDYFENIAKMFWKSEFYFYHAIAYFNHFTLSRTKNRNITKEEVTQKSSKFILSVLCIPPLNNESNQSEDAKNRAISFLSSGGSIPTKADLITYINKHNILDLCTDEIRELFYLIEESKNVVSLTKTSEPLLKSISEQYPAFKGQLQNVIVYKLLGLLSKLYTKIKIDNFSRFIGSLDFAFCENIIHIASINDHIKVRIDHRRRLLVFQDDVQDMQSLSLKFVNFSEDLKEAIYSIENKREETREQKVVNDLRDEARRYADSARTALNRRIKLISDVKRPEKEALTRQQQQRAGDRSGPSETPARTAEREALIKAAEKRKAKIEDTLAAYQRSRKENLVKLLKGIKGFRIDKKKFEDYTEDEIEMTSLDRIEKAKEEWERREKEKEEAAVRNAYKRADYLERAKREEYIHILKKSWEQTAGEKEEVMQIHKENFDQMLAFKNKIKDAAQFRQQVTTRILEERTEVYEEEMNDFREKIIEDFKGKILEMAKESLKAQLESEENEKKQRELEAAKEKQRLEENRASQADTQENRLFQRSDVRGDEMRKQQTDDTRGGFTRGGDRFAADDKKGAPSTIIQRGDVKRKDEEPVATGGFSRGTGFKPNEEVKTNTEGARPRFMNAKKEDDKKPETTTTTTTTTTTAPVADDGWRTTKKTDVPTTGGFQRGAPSTTTTPSTGGGFQRGAPSAGTTTSGTTGGPSKGFQRGAPTSSTTENKPSGGAGWRTNK